MSESHIHSIQIRSLTVVFVALFVGALSYGVSVTLYITSAQGLGPSRCQMIFSSTPFFGVLLSATVFRENFTKVQALAAGIIAVSLVHLFGEKHSHVHLHDSVSHLHGHQQPFYAVPSYFSKSHVFTPLEQHAKTQNPMRRRRPLFS